jgi:uncharacterized membrane protein
MIKVIGAMALAMVVLDIVWIQLLMKGLYEGHVSHLLRYEQGALSVEPLATILVYAVMIFGLYYFAIRPSDSLQQAIISGAIAGIFSYGTFALTNQALFNGWSWVLTLADISWGTCMMALVAAFGFWIKSL